MTFWKPKPNFLHGNIAVFCVKRKKDKKYLLYKREVDDKGKEHFHHEFDIHDLPMVRAVLDDIYSKSDW